MGRTRQKGGAMVIVVAQLCVILFLFVWAGIIIGDWSRQREEQQNQADAVSMVAMQIARTQGIDAVCQHPAMQVVMAGNSNAAVTLEDCGSFVEVDNPDGTTSLQFVANTNGPLSAGLPGVQTNYLQLDAEYAIRTSGVTAVEQDTFDEAVENRFQFVLVLDFSGSMRLNFGGQPRYQVLQQIVTERLNLDSPIDYGLVNYSGDVLDVVRPGRNTRPEIINLVNRRGPDGLTNYQAAIDRARQILIDTGSEHLNMLFISDGEPTAGGDPLDATRRAWGSDIQMMTLNIGGGAAQANLLRDMAGPPEDQGNAEYAFSANDPAALRRAFERIEAILQCNIGPIDIDIPEGELPLVTQDKVTAVLKTNRDEEIAMTAVELQQELSKPENRDELMYIFNVQDKKVYVTRETCRRVREEDARIVVRHGSLDLIQ